MEEDSKTTIEVDKTTRMRIKESAKKSETYDEYLNRLMDLEECTNK